MNAIEYALAVRLGKGVQVSQEFLNWAKNQVHEKKQDGDFFDAIWSGYERYGICEEILQPYQETYDPDLKPSNEAIHNALIYREIGLKQTFLKAWDAERGLTIKEHRSCLATLDQGSPVMCGMRWPKEGADTVVGINWMSADRVFDGHSILFVGYRIDTTYEGGGYYIISDSGPGHSDGKISFKYIRDYANDLCVVG